MKRILPLFAVVIVSLTGCSNAGPAFDKSSTTSEQKQTAEATETFVLPTRANMYAMTRGVAKSFFTSEVDTQVPGSGFSAATHIADGDATCDTMDAGDSMKSVFIVFAGTLPSLPDMEAVATITGLASGSLCPEHAGYEG
jgi:hypothetical protein